MFRPRIFVLDGDLAHLTPAEALDRLRERERPILLDSAAGEPARFSLLGFDPLPVAAPESIAELRQLGGRLATAAGDPWPVSSPPFAGGFLGALAYDLGVAGEGQELPRDPWDQPRIVGGLYIDFLLRDERLGRTWLVLGDDPGDGRESVEARRRALLDALHAPTRSQSCRALGPLERCTQADEFVARIERVRELIEAGEIYQANLSQRFVRPMEGDPIDLYATLRNVHPAPYMGYVRFDGGALLAGSPELLLEVSEQGGARHALTRPIKGTIRRDADPKRDAELRAQLSSSAKDRAELAMIVDLERNDLGRVAAPASVRVGDFPRLESYANVHHLMADVSGRLDAQRDAVDALASLFPGGSITGAPKLRSMEVIAELEGEGRGFAYGSLLAFDLTGRLSANILIRTLIWRDRPDLGGARGEVSFRVGGGITWASDPEAEDAEALLKGEALARALEG